MMGCCNIAKCWTHLHHQADFLRCTDAPKLSPEPTNTKDHDPIATKSTKSTKETTILIHFWLWAKRTKPSVVLPRSRPLGTQRL